MQKNSANIFTSFVVLSMLSQQVLTLPVFAENSNISGVTPVGGGNGEFNINPDVTKGDMGFKHYKDFNLAKDDIANLIFQKDQKQISKFVNLVDNRIYINGILNTINGSGNFYNGHAIFVSPNGMVVGASGVLNVGSLTAIAPSPMDYLKYTGYYMGRSTLNDAGDTLQIDTSVINIPTDDSVNLKLLKESDPVSDITVQGKVFARDSVELIGKHVNVGNTADARAGIFAGLPTQHDVKMDTIAQANTLFNTLVTNNVQQGSGFDRDSLGNIIIKAQSNKVAELAETNNLIVKGQEYAIEQLFKIVDDEVVVKENSELNQYGLNKNDVLNAWALALENSIPSDASNPTMMNTKNAATITINNAVLGGKNVDVNAISKVTYKAQKGSSLFDRMVNTVIDETGSTTADILLDSLTATDSRLDTFEGSRAKAEVEIGENTTLFATKDVDVKSLAMAETAIKVKSIASPLMDSTESFYFLGTKTDSRVTVKDSAELIAGEDVNVLAASKNIMNLKIKNPTSIADSVAGTVSNVPSVQVSFLQAVNEADTVAEVQKGAVIKAGNDVNVIASNFTSDQSVLQTIANVLSPTSSTSNAGIAVAVTLKDTDINTSAILDAIVEASNDVNVDAQNMHVSYTNSETKIDKLGVASKLVAGKISGKVTSLIGNKVSGIQDGLDSIASAGSFLPSASVSLVVNDSDVNATAKIGQNAEINATNNVNVDSAIVDMVVNTSSAKSAIPVNTTGTTSVIPTGGVSVIVNNQNNNSIAVIEDGVERTQADIEAGIKKPNAKITTGGDINVNATIEQPMNDATFALGLNLVQTYEDTKDMFSELPGIATHTFDFDNPDWDFRVVMEELKSVTDEEMYDIKSVMFGVKNAGITTLGLKGFFNNWAESKAKNPNAIGLAASVVVSDILNNSNARVGNYAELNSKNLIVNAANSVVQFNAAGEISSLWSIIGDNQGQSGMGGTVIVESVDSRAVSEIGDNADIVASDKVNLSSANDQDFLTVAMTGSKAKSNMGVSISGTTIVQDVKGKTESSIGDSKIKAKNLNVIAGTAQISKVPTALEQLQRDPFENLDSDHFEVGLEDGMEAAEIRRFTDTDVSVGIDDELGYDATDITNISVISGTGLAPLNPPATISDSISNIMVTGALSTQSGSSSSTSGSSGIAVGASVNVSEFAREVNALIKDGANIELAESLNVLADSKTQSLNLALAGAFAGGVSLKPNTSGTGSSNNKANSYMAKIKNLLNKADSVLGDDNDSPIDTGKLDEKDNPILTYKGTEYKTDVNGQYYDPNTGTVLKDSSGKAIKANNSLGSSSSTQKLANQGNNKKASTKNMSAALAGSVNAQINNSTVKAEIRNANIVVGKDVIVNANQKTGSLNIGGGVAKAATVGAGAAVNLIENSNSTLATINGADIDFKNSNNTLKILAEENNDNVQVAIGVGIATGNKLNPTSNVAIGGSFNTDVLTNSVNAEVINSNIENVTASNSGVENGADINTILVEVNAENHSTSYKGAGGMSINISGTNSIGGSIAGNINTINKTTVSKIDSTTMNNVTDVSVISNKNKTTPTENIIDVGVSGSVVAGTTQSSYTFTGAMSTNVISNEILAQITNNSNISASGDIDVTANSHYKNWSAAGALGFSSASKGVGVGAGSIVNVVNSDIKAEIINSVIKKSNTVDILSYNYDDLNFVALNMGVKTSNGSTVNTNGIVNVVQNEINSNFTNSTLLNVTGMNILSDYYANIFGVTGVGSISTGSGIVVGANILSNTLLSDNIAKVDNSNITNSGKTTIKATSDEKIDVTPVAVAVTASGTAAAAANVGINIVSNSTKAYIDNSEVSSAGIEITASDDTQAQTRGGTLSVTEGTVAIAGSIASDTYLKNVEAYIDNTNISKGGDIDVSATAKNIFGMENPGSITMSALADDINDGDYEVSNDLRFDKWDITFDIAGSSTTGVSGSILAKTVANNIDAYIGSGTTIQTAKSLDITATNSTSTAAVIGNVSAGGSNAIGATIFSNVNTSDVNAGIKNGANIVNIGDINIKATSMQDYHALNFVVGGAGTAAVNGAINTSIIVNETNAYIGKSTVINSTGSININANDSVDIQALQVALAASGTAAVGGIANVNVFNNNVNAIIGKNNDTSITKTGSITSSGDIKVTASSEEDYQANVAMVAASGSAAVSGVVVSNTMASEVASGIEEIDVTSSLGLINLEAKNSFNEKNKNQTSGVRNLLSNNTSLDTDDLEADDALPLVSVLNISGSGAVAVSGTEVNSNVISEVNSYVKNAEVTSKSGLSINAHSQMTTYDAVMGISGSTYASVAVTGVTNVYSGSTKAEINNSIISGDVSLGAKDRLNLNTVIFTAAGSAMGASVLPVINTNTIVNDVFADINNSEIKNASTVNILADNQINVTDAIVAGSGTGIGAAVNAVPITNVFVGNTRASIQDTSVTGSNIDTNIEAKNTINNSSVVIGASGSGIGASVSGYSMVNVFDNDLDAYIQNSTISNAKTTKTTANSDLDMVGIMGSTGVNGVGASVLVNTTTNVIQNRVNSYIDSSTITNGSILTKAIQNANVLSNNSSVGTNGIGNSTVVNSLVNVFTNELNAYISNTVTNNVSTITVLTETDEILNNSNLGIAGSGTVADIANSIVNVLENKSNAYIDSKDKSMTVTGEIKVSSEDKLSLTNSMGMAVGSGLVAAGANINVNVLNNAVKAEVLGSSTGQINAGNLDLDAKSTMYLDEGFVSASAGLVGVAGNIIINSIGSKVKEGTGVLQNAGISESVTKANENYNKNVEKISYKKGEQQKDIKNAYSLMGTSSNDRGTIANLSANITTTNSKGIDIDANNIVSGSGTNGALTLTNSTAATGAYAAGASVLVNDMNYNTSAKIAGGKVVAKNSDVNLDASSGLKANINTIEATLASKGIAGNVGYINNEAVTQAIIENSTVTANDIDINAKSSDNINVDVKSATVSGASVNLSVGVAETNNKVNAKITGDNGVDINAKNINIIADNSSSISSKLRSNFVSGYNFSTVVNRATSNAVTQALIDATGKVHVDNNLNIIAQSGGINATTTMKLGSVSLANAIVKTEGAYVNSEFSAGIDNDNIEVTSANTNIKSGVNSSNNNNAAEMKAEVLSENASISAATGSVTNLVAEVNAQTTASSNAKLHKTNNISLISKLQRTAKVGSSSGSIGVIELGIMNLISTVTGSNNIEVFGDNQVTNNFDINLSDTSNTHTQMLNAEVKLLSANINESQSVIKNDANINLGGNIAAKNINVNNNINKSSFNTADSAGVGLAKVDTYKFTTEVSGDSNVNVYATMTNENFANNLSINSKAINKAESILSDNKYALVAIAKDTSKNELSANNFININGADIKSKGDVNFVTTAENRAFMKKDSTGSGLIVFTAGELQNNINAGAQITSDNSTISANNINLETKSVIGTIDNQQTIYTIKYKDAGININRATINNTVKQESSVDITSSKLNASDTMNVKVKTESNYTQGIESDGQGFVAKNNATSNLTVTNTNNVNIDSSSELSANDVKISLDSSNTLKSYIDIDVSHFGGRDPVGNANLTLNVNNYVNNEGSVKGGNSVAIDFMKSSSNSLTQSSKVVVEAAVATAESKGQLLYNVRNGLRVAQNADITAAQDVIVNYTAGTNILSAENYLKKINRIVFGIPITKTTKSKKISQRLTNTLELNGEIEAGNNTRRYMLIKQDGTIDTSVTEGFLESDYKLIDAVDIKGEVLTAETIALLNDEITKIEDKLSKLDIEKVKYETEIQEYETLITQLQAAYDALSNKEYISESDVAATIKNNIQSDVVLANGETNSDKISQSVYDSIMNGYEQYVKNQYNSAGSKINNITSIESYLENFTYDVDNVATNLTDGQITNLINSFNAEEAKIAGISGTEVVTYNGKVVVSDGTEFNTLKSDINSTLTDWKNYKNEIIETSSTIKAQISSLTDEKTKNEVQIAYLSSHKLDDLKIDKSAIEFDNLLVQPAKIELIGIKNTNISGNGNFKTNAPNMVIENYSNRDLIFKNVDLGNAASTGLMIYGKNYNKYKNTLKPVNTVSFDGSIFSDIIKTPIGVNVHYLGDGSNANNINNIVINNYFDNSNPALSLSEAIASDITFYGYINAPEKLEIFNDSGDISFTNSISADSKEIIATQGSVSVDYQEADSKLILMADDKILAGENVDIIIKEIQLDGKIQAGYGNRTLTITEDMLSDLVIDPTTGIQNMINLGGNNKSAYLNATNNIKALYQDGKIVLFNTKQEGGNVNLNATVKGNGAILYTNGFANIKIDNQTSKTLVVNNLENNRMDGAVPKVGTITNIVNQGYTNSVTEVTSKGLLDIIGSLITGKNKKTSDGVVVNVTAQNGVEINKNYSALGEVLPTVDVIGDVNINNSGSSIIVDGVVNIADGDLVIKNERTDISVKNTIKNTNGDISISNKNGKLAVAEGGSISNQHGNTTLSNDGVGGLDISGEIKNQLGNISIENTAGKLNVNSNVSNENGNIVLNNSGSGGTTFTENATVSAKGSASKVEITNTDGGVTVANGASITNNSQTNEDNLKVSNSGNGILSVLGSIFNKKGNTTLENSGGESGISIATTGSIKVEDGNTNISNNGKEGITSDGLIENQSGSVKIVNNGESGTSFTENATVSAKGSASKVEITNTNGGVTVANGASITNNSQTNEDNLKVSNSGNGILSVLGSIFNKKGNTTIENSGSESGISIATTGSIKVEDGDISILNVGSQGTDIEGNITDEKGNIVITNKNSNIEIGEYSSDNDNYILANNGNITINQISGDILNGIVDSGNVGNNQNHDLANIDKAYKTLINSNGNLVFNVENGSVGNDTHALDGKASGFGINASTRDYTESINVKVSGTVSAENNNSELFNLRAKDSDLNIDKISTDGNIMITVADWKQADQTPPPTEEAYYQGYSVLNATDNITIPNITGKNISIISSNNIGSESNKLTYNQLEGGSVSAVAENNLYISGLGVNDTIWQIIAKRGDLDLAIEGQAVIREITANGNLDITSKGSNLTIYDLGKISTVNSNDDILYPHDGLAFENGDVVPSQIELKVLDLNQANPQDSNSTLNIFNAYVEGNGNGSADVILRADNIIAHAYDAPNSVVSTKENPKGFDAKVDRMYANDITDTDAVKDLKASGINTVGEGNALVFDIQGVSDADVIAVGANPSVRKYNMQTPVVSPKSEFKNPNSFTTPVAKVANVSLSLNSGEYSPEENRGMLITNLYADNAYIDTKDLNLETIDTFITDYAEFRNGNRSASQNGYPINKDYRWLNIVDNDYKRNIHNIYGIPVTAQLYTEKTGSFYLSMGDSITQNTKAPIVVYNPYNVVVLPHTENSFYRLTYKDNKIQYTTTTKDFEEIDKSTHLPTKREFIRFAVDKNAGMVNVADRATEGAQRIISVKDLSRGGMHVVHDGSLKLKEKFLIDISYNDISTKVEIEVVRLYGDNEAGVKFINMDKATANKILQMNMSLHLAKDIKVKLFSI